MSKNVMNILCVCIYAYISGLIPKNRIVDPKVYIRLALVETAKQFYGNQ